MYEFVNRAIKNPFTFETKWYLQINADYVLFIDTYMYVLIKIKINTVYWVRLHSALKSFAGMEWNHLSWDQMKERFG